ncbi:ubiquitin-conjugating enzyme E2Q-like protein CG4502 isoform X3 [Bombus pyrosoma]|uniref:ubiquitin-conjugating enzyme E2Q-like protein CG4502 isoform X3 n=1 Tax=Bombus pyrosoma TaxID=396416 RepID=UPI001CB89382|nr:ubiquitin-conjugating enzyme E2Q-like protein CG4502 isoform X3 [Bombus pyrosoma]XP_043579803.1 ubiquitin-conjugating enzyme E2Q-like protein CG4502 isoform X3 [Bombus pyrosoma]XP_043579804.1 ubiquitin-conjugating enzyme E2Q-like protein CG4502 isoform X3 [Bombus pyrosoma]XP_043579805.1 ubiquitin-conjugating enzyme E2Q-like protein CG4502 isoform X3 [Bombus pyrosoma]XP_043579806.1 ubiquitin-conjugating enzyme E2Q-like protein CG4502 isoform X3 [Bombus pyrosoma]
MERNKSENRKEQCRGRMVGAGKFPIPGYSLKNRVLMEKPDVSFNYKYILLANRDYSINPIICSTFKTYKDNEIKDDCTLIKVREVDTNMDGRKDILKFEAHFYTDEPIRSLKLLLFFNFQLKQLVETTVESIAYFTHTLNEEAQKVCFYGDLILQQKSVITSEGLYQTYNRSIEIADYSIDELLMENFKRKSYRKAGRTMSTRSKEKVVAVFRKFFRPSEKISEQDGASSSTSSPSRRLLSRHHRPDAVTPTDATLSDNAGASNSNHASCFFKSKKSTANSTQGTIAMPDKGLRLRRLMKELSEIQRMQNRLESTFTAELVNDNLFEWHVRLHKIDPESELAADMRELDIPYILLHVVFPENFPFAPPFMRVISPRIEKGFVMEGGAICMELLTPRGWASAYTIEAVIMQFAASIVKGQGRVARKPKTSKEFNRRSAEESFRSLVKTHEKYGWVTPPLTEG